jgi:hypothetical protein
MRWEIRNAPKILVGKPKRRNHFGELGAAVIITLK